MCRADKMMLWEFSSAGRASALQAEGHRFEPCNSHHIPETWPGSSVGENASLSRWRSTVRARSRSPTFLKKLDMLVWLNGRAADL